MPRDLPNSRMRAPRALRAAAAAGILTLATLSVATLAFGVTPAGASGRLPNQVRYAGATPTPTPADSPSPETSPDPASRNPASPFAEAVGGAALAQPGVVVDP